VLVPQLALTMWRYLIALTAACCLFAMQDSDRNRIHIRLKSVTFDPLQTAGKDASEGGERWIVQLHRQPSRDDRAKGTYGLKLDHYIPNSAFLEKLKPAAAERVRASGLVRWVGPYLPDYKVDPDVAKQGPGAILLVEGFSDLTAEALAAAVRNAGFTAVEKTETGSPRLRLRANSPNDAAGLAALPEVYFIQPVARIDIDTRAPD
jgi:hypothetical protein